MSLNCSMLIIHKYTCKRNWWKPIHSNTLGQLWISCSQFRKPPRCYQSKCKDGPARPVLANCVTNGFSKCTSSLFAKYYVKHLIFFRAQRVVHTTCMKRKWYITCKGLNRLMNIWFSKRTHLFIPLLSIRLGKLLIFTLF